MKVWENRFTDREHSPWLEAYNASFKEDAFLYEAEIAASRAWANALARAGILSKKENRIVSDGLKKVRVQFMEGSVSGEFEDIHSAVEMLLSKEIGHTAKKLHTGRSRNEQVATDERIYLKNAISRSIQSISRLQAALLELAENLNDIIMPGYTHLQPAQPVLFSHYLLSFFWPFERTKERLDQIRKRTAVLPLGSGALAGSSIKIDRGKIAKELDFSAVTHNSLDAVADRSFIHETLFAFALASLDISRFAEDMIIYTSREFGFIEMDDVITTSSSLMPQKKNPDFFELMRSAPGLFFGHLSRIFMIQKALPTSYNKDLQWDKKPLREGVDDFLSLIHTAILVIPRIKPNLAKMRGAIEPGMYATDIVDYLMNKGLAFRDAYNLTGKIVAYSEKQSKCLDQLDKKEWNNFSPLFDDTVFQVFNPETSVKNKKTSGSTHPASVAEQILHARSCLEKKI